MSEALDTAVVTLPVPAPEVKVGASLRALTTSDAESVAVENAAAPPLVDVSAVLPFVPLV
jgi:hypothetical protein